ncbi:MAG: fructose-6-phosphate aldolase [Flavobacteriales bacterium]|jgi:transaldolase|uniref:fructose-6-phosphate aldolase n=1 Tax=Blattabacterium sp. (Mastotermes darwiniensis) TaxID=39768 RepID=UPI000231DE88|nr:fructose-6-phosphate aldolase [Blattabacterium sp. (Mastotermes darwiniensis)]AER40700.1 transaldolase [Blattabacterium sp. (Mastotermes darwiniensis) str. MADAR]MDR1804772.1 fructose-6-phosphate aldolase [Flavobacteriales bacterium]
MKFFIDTANLEEIRKAQLLGLLDGITTNPSLISKEIIDKSDIYNHYTSICNLLKREEGNVSIEVISTNYTDMIQEGEKLSLLHPKIVVKIPISKDGIKAIKYLSNKNIKTNCTLVFSLGQALLAAKVGSNYVSPFIGRLDDISYNGLSLVKEIKTIYEYYHFNTKILAASIRNPFHILECAKIGIHAVTTPFKVIDTLFYHPLTKIGLKKFLKDYDNINES